MENTSFKQPDNNNIKKKESSKPEMSKKSVNNRRNYNSSGSGNDSVIENLVVETCRGVTGGVSVIFLDLYRFPNLSTNAGEFEQFLRFSKNYNCEDGPKLTQIKRQEMLNGPTFLVKMEEMGTQMNPMVSVLYVKESLRAGVISQICRSIKLGRVIVIIESSSDITKLDKTNRDHNSLILKRELVFGVSKIILDLDELNGLDVFCVFKGDPDMRVTLQRDLEWFLKIVKTNGSRGGSINHSISEVCTPDSLVSSFGFIVLDLLQWLFVPFILQECKQINWHRTVVTIDNILQVFLISLTFEEFLNEQIFTHKDIIDHFFRCAGSGGCRGKKNPCEKCKVRVKPYLDEDNFLGIKAVTILRFIKNKRARNELYSEFVKFGVTIDPKNLKLSKMSYLSLLCEGYWRMRSNTPEDKKQYVKPSVFDIYKNRKNGGGALPTEIIVKRFGQGTFDDDKFSKDEFDRLLEVEVSASIEEINIRERQKEDTNEYLKDKSTVVKNLIRIITVAKEMMYMKQAKEKEIFKEGAKGFDDDGVFTKLVGVL